MADQSRVYIHELAEFGLKIAGFGMSSTGSPGASNAMTDFTKGLGTALGGISKGTVAGAGLGTNEAKTFRDWYSQGVVAPTSNFTGDTPKRLMALGGGAVVMAGNYTDGDASQATAMARAKASNEVSDMFTADPKGGLDGDLAKQGSGGKDQPVVKPLPPPNTKEDPIPKGPETPQQRASRQAQQHTDKYGKDETWPKPPKEPKTKILAPGPIGEQPPSTGVTA